MPISIGLAWSSIKKLLSNTPPVMVEKMVAKTPSLVEAAKLWRITALEIATALGASGNDSAMGAAGDSARSREVLESVMLMFYLNLGAFVLQSLTQAPRQTAYLNRNKLPAIASPDRVKQWQEASFCEHLVI